MKMRSTLAVTKKSVSGRYDFSVFFVDTPFPLWALKILVKIKEILGSREWAPWCANELGRKGCW